MEGEREMSAYSRNVFLKTGLKDTDKAWEHEGNCIQLCPAKDAA